MDDSDPARGRESLLDGASDGSCGIFIDSSEGEKLVEAVGELGICD